MGRMTENSLSIAIFIVSMILWIVAIWLMVRE